MVTVIWPDGPAVAAAPEGPATEAASTTAKEGAGRPAGSESTIALESTILRLNDSYQ